MANEPFEPDPIEESQPSLSIANAIAASNYYGHQMISGDEQTKADRTDGQSDHRGDRSAIAIKIYDE